MTDDTLHINQTQLTLKRYPPSKDPNLRAWSAADELLIEHVIEHVEPNQLLTVLNDEFGALACALRGYPLHWYSDSYIAHQALIANLDGNHLDPVERQHSLAPLVVDEWILLRIPKSLAYLEYQLAQISAAAKPNTQIIATGMVKNLPKTVFALFERYLGPVTTSLAQKKARLLFCKSAKPPQKSKYPLTWTTPEQGWQLTDHANLFCLGKLDIGTRFLLGNMPKGDFQSVIDLGCGNGLLSLEALRQYPNAQVLGVDESYMAVGSARGNVIANRPDDANRTQFSQDNCLESQPCCMADLILCNPPFHQQNVISTHIAAQMFKDAHRCLAPGGTLCVVANRHLPYQGLLKKYFGGFKVLASNPKFVILTTNKAMS
jgi:16S rRNA G1207 methylase RsmC